METVPIDDRVGLQASVRATLEDALRGHRLLQDVVRWALGQGHALIDVVVQDEYTHDIVIRWTDDLVLVFDAT